MPADMDDTLARPQPLRWLPFLRWFPLRPGQVRADVLAGLTVGLLVVPQALAYAKLAGMPPHYGLYAAFLPVMLAALFGWCHQMATGPVAMTSLLVASVLTPLVVSGPGSEDWIRLAIVLGGLVGLLRLALGLLRASWVVNFIGHPVMLGFSAAGGFIIGCSQLHDLIGVPGARSQSFLGDELQILSRVGQAHLPTVAMGLGSLALMLLLRRWRRFPGMLAVIAGATVVSWATGYEAAGGRIVGAIPEGLPPVALPTASWSEVVALVPGACLVTLIGFMEAYAVAKSCAVKTRQDLHLDQDMLGQGVAAVAGSLTQAYPVSGSLSRSAANLAAGAMTGMSSLVTGLVVLATLLFATPLLHHLPNAALAAAIAVAVITLVDVPGMRRCWQANRHDGLAVVITALGTLLLAPDLVAGVLLGAGLAMFLFLARTMTPRTVVLGQHADGTWRDADRHGLPVHEHLIMLRVDGRLFFASVTHVEQAVLGVLRRFPGVRAIILHGDGINEIDAAGEDLLRKLHRRLDDNGVILAFAGLKAQVTDVLTNTGLERELGPTRLFRSPEAALVALERELDLPETTPRFDTAAP